MRVHLALMTWILRVTGSVLEIKIEDLKIQMHLNHREKDAEQTKKWYFLGYRLL